MNDSVTDTSYLRAGDRPGGDSRPVVVLYNPDAVFFDLPLALLAVGSNLDPERFDVRIVDARMVDDPTTLVLALLPRAICFGVTVLSGAPIRDALEMTEKVKAARPDLPTVWGGWHPSLFPEQTSAHPLIDAVVCGQGEATFAELLERVVRNERFGDVAGLAVGGVKNDARPLEDMDAFAAPDFGLVDVEDYFARKQARQMDYITSTGCPFRCAFCADPNVYDRKYKVVSPARLADEIEALWRRYRFTDLNFQDETFFVYRKRVEEIAGEFLTRDMAFSWAATMRADQGARMDEETFALCRASGLRRVLIGVESGDTNIIARIKKDTTLEQVIASAEMCLRHDVAIIFSFIVGFPGETDRQVQTTLDLIKRLRAMSPSFEAHLFYYKPYPGTDLTRTNTDVPESLEGWADFDYVDGSAPASVSPAMVRRIERFKFYAPLAWGRHRRWLAPLSALARLRCRRDYYALPVEKLAAERLRPAARLS